MNKINHLLLQIAYPVVNGILSWFIIIHHYDFKVCRKLDESLKPKAFVLHAYELIGAS